MDDGLLQRYRSMVFKGELTPDTAGAKVDLPLPGGS